MSAHREYQTYKKHDLTVEIDAPGGRVLKVWIAGYNTTFDTVEDAERQIDEDLAQAVAMPPLPEPREEPPPRVRMRL